MEHTLTDGISTIEAAGLPARVTDLTKALFIARYWAVRGGAPQCDLEIMDEVLQARPLSLRTVARIVA